MSKSARLIMTFDCNKNCENCANKFDSILDKAIKRDDLHFITRMDLDEIIITGGEPLLYPDYLISLIKRIREIKPDITIYLYSAIYKPAINKILKLIDGLHYTVHNNPSAKEIRDFYSIQFTILNHPDVSFRTFINENIDGGIEIKPSLWDRLEIKGYLSEENCPLPEDELIIWREEINSLWTV